MNKTEHCRKSNGQRRQSTWWARPRSLRPKPCACWSPKSITSSTDPSLQTRKKPAHRTTVCVAN